MEYIYPKPKQPNSSVLHQDARMTWKHHVKQRALQISLKMREMHRLIRPYSKLSLRNKIAIYKAIVRPIWTYSAQLWGCVKTFNCMITQRSQSKLLRAAVYGYRYTRNEDKHRDLKINSLDKVYTRNR